MTTPDILLPIESTLNENPGNGALVSAYLETALATHQTQRAGQFLAAYLNQLGIPLRLKLGRALCDEGLYAEALEFLPEEGAESQLWRARALLAMGQRSEATDAYYHAVAENPTLEDFALKSELDGRVVRIDAARNAARVTSIANEETRESDVMRLIQPEQRRIVFADVGGLDEIKKQIRRRILTPFQKPTLFQRFAKKAGGGVLMYGPPGCGKTLLARATAGECGATFYNVQVSDVLDMYIGESERKLHALFDQARRNKPAVLFFDEVEALGGKRQYNREATSAKLVSQFLAELDGFAQDNDGVLILAATNVPWAVDPAFRRPGRFDRVLFVPPPDQAARRDILAGLMSNRPTSGPIDLDFIARNTSGFSGADIADVVETAVDEAIEASIDRGEEVPLTDALLKFALKQARSTTLEWLSTARNYARYANEGGQYDEVLDFLKTFGKP
ncbi:MAG: ATP-binding protein [Rhodocyclales bacterium]|nr:ATP-binding protein [Rhodocyclales bacterium]